MALATVVICAGAGGQALGQNNFEYDVVKEIYSTLAERLVRTVPTGIW